VTVATRWLTKRAAAREVERKLKTHAPASAFDYLLREPRDARRSRQIWITCCIVAFVVLAALAWVIGN
jgi:hypothetical protein